MEVFQKRLVDVFSKTQAFEKLVFERREHQIRKITISIEITKVVN